MTICSIDLAHGSHQDCSNIKFAISLLRLFVESSYVKMKLSELYSISSALIGTTIVTAFVIWQLYAGSEIYFSRKTTIYQPKYQPQSSQRTTFPFSFSVFRIYTYLLTKISSSRDIGDRKFTLNPQISMKSSAKIGRFKYGII